MARRYHGNVDAPGDREIRVHGNMNASGRWLTDSQEEGVFLCRRV